MIIFIISAWLSGNVTLTLEHDIQAAYGKIDGYSCVAYHTQNGYWSGCK